MSKGYWLFKSEPSEFSIDDLERSPGKTTYWDGVRNYQARNFLRDSIKIGDLVFFYHSNTDPLAIVGICEVVKEGYPDFTAFDKSNPHFDPKSKKDAPTWYMVDIKLKEIFKKPVTLEQIKNEPGLQQFRLLQKGNRLSVFPVSESEWKQILLLKDR